MMVVSIGNPQHYCRAYSSVCSERRIQLACRYESPGTLLGCRNGRFQDYGRIAVERFTQNVFPYCASRPIKRRRRRRRFEDLHARRSMGQDSPDVGAFRSQYCNGRGRIVAVILFSFE